MKRIAIVFFMMLAKCASVCGQEEPNLGLIPTPQRTEIRKGACNIEKAKTKETKVTALPVEANAEQGYQIMIEPKSVTIKYISAEGLENARQTLAQLREIHGELIPCCEITDWPAYRWRGWMDDISRGPVTHATYRQRQWERLHNLKYNFCNYYTEHTLYQSEFPDLAPAYAKECKPHSDEVINLQLFAHAEKTLRIPFYETLKDSKANFNPGIEATYDFLAQRIRAAYERIPDSPFFIINCDETEQLGSGRAKKLVDSVGESQVYVDFINRCHGIIEDTYFIKQKEDVDVNNKRINRPRVVMWGDIVAKNPQMMRQLPKDIVYIMWAYEPLESYAELIRPFKEQENTFWVAPSAGHHSNTLPNPAKYMKNIANLARDGYRDGADGLMNTSWDDSGEALFDNCWHALYWSAEMAWNPIKTDDPEELRKREEQFNKNFERLFYGNTATGSSQHTQALYAVGGLETNIATKDYYASSSLWQPLLDINTAVLGQSEESMIETLSQVEPLIDSAANPHAHYTFMRLNTSASKLTLQKAIDRQLKEGHTENECRAFADIFFQDLKNLKREYLRLWDQENGDYERYVVMNRYDDMARQVLELDRHVFIDISPNAAKTPHVQLRTLYGDKDIYYTLDGSEPTSAATKYTEPFPLERSATIRTISYNEYGEGVETSQYLLSHLAMGVKIELATRYGSQFRAVYSGGGDNALTDGLLGSNTTYTDGHWQGYWGDSIDARIDFGSSREIHSITMRFVQNTFDWVLAPKQVKIYTSSDRDNWQLLTEKSFTTDPRETGFILKHYTVEIPASTPHVPKCQTTVLQPFATRYLRVVVPSGGPLPEWHTAPGQPSWLFCDEIVVK